MTTLGPIEAQEEDSRRFSNLRSVNWRIDLGILPLGSIDGLRKASADSRRRYVNLRRRLLINPHLTKDEYGPSDPSIDNPLSQNPESTWGKYFRNAELEKTVEQDLVRLYPEASGSFFQTPRFQNILSRILLVWSLHHPQFSYRQGMHELLAPLVYTLQMDLDRLSKIRKLHSEFFTDPDFSESLFPKSGNPIPNPKTPSKTLTDFDDLDPEKKQIFLLSDPYGPEGELGVVLSEKFLEHDAYSMFDGLMDSVSEFFSDNTLNGPGLPPVIEASSAIYHLLNLVDPFLHAHLVELGVEPQYFALRWLRVLYVREFNLDDLLLIWDEIFSYKNENSDKNYGCSEIDAGFRVLRTDRGAFIASFGVSMIVHLRPAILATENVTICLQKLLNFPKNIEIKNFILKSRVLFKTALNANQNRLGLNKTPPHHPVSNSYWEEKWRVLHKTESLDKDLVHGGPIKKKKSLRERFGLSRTGSAPLEKEGDGVRRRLFDEVEKTEGLDANLKFVEGSKSENASIDVSLENDDVIEGCASSSVPNYVLNGSYNNGDNAKKNGGDMIGASGSVQGEVTSCDSSSSSSCSFSGNNNNNNYENDTDKSSVTSNSFLCEIVEEEGDICKNGEKEVEIEKEKEKEKEEGVICKNGEKEVEIEKEEGVICKNEEEKEKGELSLKENRSGKFGWFFKFGNNNNNNNNNNKNNNNVDKNNNGGEERKLDKEDPNPNSNSNSYSGGDKKVMGTFKNIGQSMLDNIQVIESVFQQDRGKGQAMAALTELRKISNLLKEM